MKRILVFLAAIFGFGAYYAIALGDLQKQVRNLTVLALLAFTIAIIFIISAISYFFHKRYQLTKG